MSKNGHALHCVTPGIPIGPCDPEACFFDREKERVEMHLKAGRKTWAENMVRYVEHSMSTRKLDNMTNGIIQAEKCNKLLDESDPTILKLFKSIMINQGYS
jgi:hypothetical protein